MLCTHGRSNLQAMVCSHWRRSFNSFRDHSMMSLRTPYSWSMSCLRCASEYSLAIHTATSICFQFALTLVPGARCCEDSDVDVKHLDKAWNRVRSSTWPCSVRGRKRSNISLAGELGMMSVKLESFCYVTHDMEFR